MAIYQQITESSLGWLFALVAIAILAGSVWTGFLLWRHGISRLTAVATGVVLFLLQLLVYEMVQRRMQDAIQSSEGLGTGMQVLVAVFLAIVPLLIPLMAAITLRVMSPREK